MNIVGLEQHILEIKLTLERQNVVLAEHIRRTIAAEERIDLLHLEIQPLKDHVAMWAGAGKVLTVVAAALAAAAAIVKILGH